MSFVLSLCISFYTYADEEEYAISAINLIVNVTDELNVLTRNVSDGNAALDKLDATANELLTTYTNNDIYLDVFPDDISFEILVTSTQINNTQASDFKSMEDSEFTSYMDKLSESYAASDESELLNIDIYQNTNSKYIVTAARSNVDKTDVYTLRYYTVINGYNYNFTLQSNDLSAYEGAADYIKSIVDSAQYTEVEAALTESSIFMQMLETFIGFGATILILVIILLFISRASKVKR
jgi:hypothetical protein